MRNINPFTKTPGLAGKAYIDTDFVDEIISEFDDEESGKHVYKIVGVRGSGKSVAYSKIMSAFEKKKKWLVFMLAAAEKPIDSLIAYLSKKEFIDSDKHSSTFETNAEINGDLSIFSGSASVNISKSKSREDRYYAEDVELSEMVDKVNRKGLRILVGIDDISKTPEMVKFLSVFGSMLLGGKKIYLLCTGLEKNIEDFTGESNLTFFKRSDFVVTKGLNKFEISEMYQKLLHVDAEEGAKLAKLVNGYAFAYQTLGSLYYKHRNSSVEDILPEFDMIMAKDSYDLIWMSLTPAEKDLVRIIVNSSGKVSEIKKQMENPNSFDMLRKNLMIKHLINLEERGSIEIILPRFKEFINFWYVE